MRFSMFFFLAACLVLLASFACAQVDPNDDGVGIYADLDATSNSISAEPYVPIEVYLLLTRPTVSIDIAAWECDLLVPDNAEIWGFALPAETSDGWFMIDSYGYAGIFEDYLPPTNIVKLMTFIIMMTDNESGEFFILPHGNDAGGLGDPNYFTFGEGGVLPYSMHPYQQGDGDPAFKVNDTITPVVSASWGEIKALYQ